MSASAGPKPRPPCSTAVSSSRTRSTPLAVLFGELAPATA
jgi:hypothetical protein